MKYIKKIITIILITLYMISYFGTSTVINAAGSISDVMDDASEFVSIGEEPVSQDPSKVTPATDFIYNLLLAIGIIMAVAIGAVLGIKFMLASVEEQAKIKELLVPYIAGCIVIFGSLGIWKLAVNVFKGF